MTASGNTCPAAGEAPTEDTRKDGSKLAPSKKQTTMAKIAREQAVRERRARKQQKKDDKKQVATAPDEVADDPVSALSADGEAVD